MRTRRGRTARGSRVARRSGAPISMGVPVDEDPAGAWLSPGHAWGRSRTKARRRRAPKSTGSGAPPGHLPFPARPGRAGGAADGRGDEARPGVGDRPACRCLCLPSSPGPFLPGRFSAGAGRPGSRAVAGPLWPFPAFHPQSSPSGPAPGSVYDPGPFGSHRRP